jgi:hypothetical protein
MPVFRHTARPRGTFGLQKFPASDKLEEFSWRELARKALPQRGLSDEVNEWRLSNMGDVVRRFRRVKKAAKYHSPIMVGSFGIRKLDVFGNPLIFGVSGLNVVTQVFVNEVVDEMQTSTGGIDLFSWHAVGENSTTAPAIGDTQLAAELPAARLTGGGRASGSQTEGSSADVYETVGTNTIAASTAAALLEVGVFNSSSTGSGILADRDTFAVINLSSGESLQSTYDLTFAGGG